MGILLPDGVWAVMLTPFNDDNSIDFSGIDRLVEFYISYGINGIFACCGSSEIEYLTNDEILKISRYVVECVDGRLPVISGAIVFDKIARQAELTQEIANTGTRAVVVSTNQFNYEDDSDEQFFQKIKEFVSNIDSDINLGTYELPTPYKRLIPHKVYNWLAASGRFLFHKDTSCDLKEIKTKIKKSYGTKLKFYNANLQTLVQSLNAGANGYCGTGTNYCPELYVWIHNNFDKYPKKTEMVQDYLNKLEKSVDLGQNYPASAKAYLTFRDINIGHLCRTPLPAITQEQILQLKDVYRWIQKVKRSENLSEKNFVEV